MKKLNGKACSDYTSLDLRNFWCKEYYRKIGEDYQPHGYGGNELKALKTLMIENDIFCILVAIRRALKVGVRDIHNFAESFEQFIPRFGKIEFFVAEQGSQVEKDKFFELILLDSKWLSGVEDDIRKKKLLAWFEEWIERKNGKL